MLHVVYQLFTALHVVYQLFIALHVVYQLFVALHVVYQLSVALHVIYQLSVAVTNDRSEARVDPLAALIVQGQTGKYQAEVSRAT